MLQCPTWAGVLQVLQALQVLQELQVLQRLQVLHVLTFIEPPEVFHAGCGTFEFTSAWSIVKVLMDLFIKFENKRIVKCVY